MMTSRSNLIDLMSKLLFIWIGDDQILLFSSYSGWLFVLLFAVINLILYQEFKIVVFGKGLLLKLKLLEHFLEIFSLGKY